jgi:hypothetical protein
MSIFTPQNERWMLEAFGPRFPPEPRATCDACVMCGPSPLGIDLHPRFVPELKCCTYPPVLANYLVGRALGEEAPGGGPSEGARRLRAQVADRVGLTPFGLEPSPRRDAAYRAHPEGFGRDPSLACSYLVDGRCVIWAHRNAVCQAFFCVHDAGVLAARAFTLVTRLLRFAEDALAADHVAALLGHPAALSACFDDLGRRRSLPLGELPGWVDPDGVVSEALHERLWGPWLGREAEFFRACAERAEGLSWADVRRVGGVGLAALEAKLREALDRRDGPVPLRLVGATPGVDVSWSETLSGDVLAAHVDDVRDPVLVPRAAWETLVGSAKREVPESALGEGMRSAAWRAGLVEEAPPRGPAPPPAGPIDPASRLRVPQPLEVRERVAFDVAGRAVVSLRIGLTELTLDADLVGFGRGLARERRGFTAGDVATWAPAGATLPWPRVAELLGQLVELGVLERAPAR